MKEMPKPNWMFSPDPDMWLRCITAIRLGCLTPAQANWIVENVWIVPTFGDDMDSRAQIVARYREHRYEDDTQG